MPGWWVVGMREKLWQRESLKITWVWFLGIEESFLGIESLAAIDLRAELPLATAVVVTLVCASLCRSDKPNGSYELKSRIFSFFAPHK